MSALERASGKAAALVIAEPLFNTALADGDPLALGLVAIEETVVWEIAQTTPLTQERLRRAVADRASVMGAADGYAAACAVVDSLLNVRSNYKPFTRNLYKPGVGMTEHSFTLFDLRLDATGSVSLRASEHARRLLLSMLDLDAVTSMSLFNQAISLAVADGKLSSAAQLAVAQRINLDHLLLDLRRALDEWRAGHNTDESFINEIRRALRVSANAPEELATLRDKVKLLGTDDGAVADNLGMAAQSAFKLRSFLWDVHTKAVDYIAERCVLKPSLGVNPSNVLAVMMTSTDISRSTALDIYPMTVPKLLDWSELFFIRLNSTPEDADEALQVNKLPSAAVFEETSQAGNALMERLLASTGTTTIKAIATSGEPTAVIHDAICRMFAAAVESREGIKTQIGADLALALYSGSDIEIFKEHHYALAA